ncbi:hypothetical protein [Arthrobacter sp. SX1312]|uniref:hypothetical protein n=1 Tax=Arthrobacter sp. SX1312 TaxID=2058896 RepID=UPI0011B0C10B|nr:hypothetical protein [Arthrobacter sp. SX1312]
MEPPSKDHHLQDLGSTDGTDPADSGQVQNDPPADADPSPETLAGNLGFEGSADSPTGDDRFTGGSH